MPPASLTVTTIPLLPAPLKVPPVILNKSDLSPASNSSLDPLFRVSPSLSVRVPISLPGVILPPAFTVTTDEVAPSPMVPVPPSVPP